MRGPGGSWRLILLTAVFLTLPVPSAAAAATVVNGDFESGNLNGWHVHRVTESANWFAYKGADPPIGKKENPHPVQAPPQGAYAAITDEVIPDTLILYQDVALEAGSSHWLSLFAYYDSYKPIVIPTPDTLSVDEEVLGGKSNQQFRIDVMRPDAPLESIDPTDILRTLFRTEKGDPVALQPTRMTADLSSFAGQTVRLRIANAVTDEVFNAGVDAVSISKAPPGQSLPGGSKKQGPSSFSFGKVRANRHNGTVSMRVRVSGPGLLTAKDALPSAPTAHASKAKKPRKLIKPTTVRASSARTVTLRLKPTPPAREILKQKHKLRVKVAVTFRPAGGSAETATVPVVLRLAPRPSQRR